MTKLDAVLAGFKTRGSNLSEVLEAVKEDDSDNLCHCGCPKIDHQNGRGRCLNCWDCEGYEASGEVYTPDYPDDDYLFGSPSSEAQAIRDTEEKNRKRRMGRRKR
jgi:hypothetical protein